MRCRGQELFPTAVALRVITGVRELPRSTQKACIVPSGRPGRLADQPVRPGTPTAIDWNRIYDWLDTVETLRVDLDTAPQRGSTAFASDIRTLTTDH